MQDKSLLISRIDKFIFGCAILFLISLDLSIFVNQLGYYGALLLLLVRYSLTRENKFRKTGLELAFILFLLAELLSAFFSINKPLAFHNVLRRALLIPTCYTIVAAADDLKKAKLFFKVYIGFAFIVIILYIGVAWQYFISQLYQIEGKGPSVFQYVMTAGGLMSFTVIFTYAFLINEKDKLSRRLLYLAAFILSLIALGASDTRAAWIGAGAGVVFITIVKRKWIILLPIVALLAAFMFIQKNKSNLYVYNYNNGRLTLEATSHMAGRPYGLYASQDTLIVAGFEEGLLTMKDSRIITSVKTPAPVSNIIKLKNNIFSAFLIDQRIMIYARDSARVLKQINEIIPQGVVSVFNSFNGHLYIPLVNGPLTVYPDPAASDDVRIFPQIKDVIRVAADSNYLAVFNKENMLELWSLKAGIPERKMFSRNIKTNYGFLALVDNHLFVSTEKELMFFRIESDSFQPDESNPKLDHATNFIRQKDKLFVSDVSGTISELEYPVKNGRVVIKHVSHLGFNPFAMEFNGGKFFVSEVRRNRIASLFDPYHPSNLQRINQWQAGLRILKDHPLFGVGDIDMHPVYKKYMNYYETETFGHLHNDYIHFLAILGIVGFAAAMFLFFRIYMVNRKIYRSLQGIKFVSSYALGAWAGCVGFMVSGLGEWNFGDHEIITMVWFMLGLNLAFYYNSTNKKSINDKESLREETALKS